MKEEELEQDPDGRVVEAAEEAEVPPAATLDPNTEADVPDDFWAMHVRKQGEVMLPVGARTGWTGGRGRAVKVDGVLRPPSASFDVRY